MQTNYADEFTVYVNAAAGSVVGGIYKDYSTTVWQNSGTTDYVFAGEGDTIEGETPEITPEVRERIARAVAALKSQLRL